MSQSSSNDTYAFLLYDEIGWQHVEEAQVQVGFSKISIHVHCRVSVIQVNKNSLYYKWTYYRNCRKTKETSSDSGIHVRAIVVLHEQWMCLGMQRHTHITLCNLVTIKFDSCVRPYTTVYTSAKPQTVL